MNGLAYLNLTATIVMFLYTSYLDLTKREVEDKVWLVFAGLGCALEAYEVVAGLTVLSTLLVSVAIATAVGMGLYLFGFYGGADGKALIVLAILLPVYVPKVGLYDLVPLMVLTNGVLTSMLLPLGLVITNLIRIAKGERIFEGFDEPFYRKALALMLGYKQTGKPKRFQFSLERTMTTDLADDGPARITAKKKFDFSLTRDEFEEKTGTWVTPGIPLLVFFAAGLVALLLYGDLVIGLIQFVAKIV
jgi:preflagellin peptidase FlaK